MNYRIPNGFPVAIVILPRSKRSEFVDKLHKYQNAEVIGKSESMSIKRNGPKQNNKIIPGE